MSKRMFGTPWRRAHRGFERCGSVVRPQEGYSPEILSHLSKEYVPSKGIRSLFLARTINSTIIIEKEEEEGLSNDLG